MKKTLLAVILALFPVIAYSAPPTSYGFRAYSSAASVVCGVFGGKEKLNKDANGYIIQGHAPDTAYARVYSLGTKGFANHSTAGQASMTFTCTESGTNTPVAVKVFMNGVETYFLTLDSYTFVIGR